MKTLLVHIHIPKCGGLAVADALRRNFARGFAHTHDDLLHDYQYDAQQVAAIARNHPHLRCLSGHKFSLDLPFDDHDLDVRAVTFIRDPVDRFVSHYFYHRHHTSVVPEAKRMDLLQYAQWAFEAGHQRAYINGQVSFLNAGSFEGIRTMVEDGRLLLFPLAELQRSLYTLAHRLPGMFGDFHVRSTNASRRDQVVPQDLHELVRPHCEQDLKLLELARQTALHDAPPRDAHRWWARRFGVRAAGVLRRAASFIERRC